MIKDKFILDACCGPRMMWFNKHHPNVIYIDNRIRERGFVDNRENRYIQPDIQADFKDLSFLGDKKFKLIVMDPPHLLGNKDSCRMITIFGCLNKNTWKGDIKKGFDECWKYLEDYGVLIFKWADHNIKINDLLNVLNKEPLFGHTSRRNKSSSTHWFVFMKIPEVIK